MHTPQDKYENDPTYKRFVDVIEALLHECQLTPSEVREGAVLACIHHEMRSFTRVRAVPNKVVDALNTIRSYRTTTDKPGKCDCGVPESCAHEPGCAALLNYRR